MTAIPLRIHPWPLPEGRLDLLRKAKMMLQTEIKVIPVEALPGSTGRVLAFGEPPPFFSESVLVRNVDDVDSVRNALSFLLEAPDGADQLFTEEDWLSSVMGVPVTFMGEESTNGEIDRNRVSQHERSLEWV